MRQGFGHTQGEALADWLKNDLVEVTAVILLGGDVFKANGGTIEPDRNGPDFIIGLDLNTRKIASRQCLLSSTLTLVRTLPPTFGDVFDLHVSLRDITPPIWRRLRVPADTSLRDLHDVLQIAFGWKDYHLHDFLVGDIRFSVPDIEDEMFAVDERGAPLGAVARAGSELVYRYDYGDDWDHVLKVERVMQGKDGPIVCTGGARACPPEDCGGASGYARLLEVLANPKDDEHREMKQWVGRGYDPEKFNIVAVNRKLATLSRQLGRRRT